MTNFAGIGFMSGAPSIFALDFVSTAINLVSSVTHTFSNVDIGAPADDRIVQIYVSARLQTSVSSVVINGITALLGASQNFGSSTARMAYALVPTGTLVTVTVVTAASTTNCGLTIFRLTGVVDPPVEQIISSSSSPISLTATLDATKKALVGFTSDNNGGGNVTFANATETSDYPVQSGVQPHQATGIVTASGLVQVTQAGFTQSLLNMQTWTAA